MPGDFQVVGNAGGNPAVAQQGKPLPDGIDVTAMPQRAECRHRAADLLAHGQHAQAMGMQEFEAGIALAQFRP